MKKFITLIVLALGLPSCGKWILEDRTDCPSFLFFDVEDGHDVRQMERVYITAAEYPEGKPLAADTTSLRALKDQSFSLAIKRCEAVSGYGMVGFLRSHQEGPSRWVVNEGQNGDPIYHFSYQTSALDERETIPARLRKSHSRITIRFFMFDAFPQSGGQFPFQVILRSHTCGLDMESGNPVQGSFRYTPPEERAGVFSVIVPRQADHSLTLELWARPGLYEKEGFVDEFDLWTLLRELDGFSWEMEDLPDLLLEIDYVQSRISLTISEWEEGATIDYEI